MYLPYKEGFRGFVRDSSAVAPALPGWRGQKRGGKSFSPLSEYLQGCAWAYACNYLGQVHTHSQTTCIFYEHARYRHIHTHYRLSSDPAMHFHIHTHVRISTEHARHTYIYTQ